MTCGCVRSTVSQVSPSTCVPAGQSPNGPSGFTLRNGAEATRARRRSVATRAPSQISQSKQGKPMTEGANYEDHDFYCAECDLDWPCDEARLIAEVDRLHRQITQLADELDDTGGFNDVVSRSRRQCAARSFWPFFGRECPDGPHRGPEGPNEDIGQCGKCGSPTFRMRPPGETFGTHADDCSLPI